MEALIADVIDVAGIARPMAFIPDYPARLLAREPEPPLPTGPRPTTYRPLNGYLQLAIHNHQFHRIAAGRTPQTKAGYTTALRAIAKLGAAAATQLHQTRLHPTQH
jgi:hypothetical protein